MKIKFKMDIEIHLSDMPWWKNELVNFKNEKPKIDFHFLICFALSYFLWLVFLYRRENLTGKEEEAVTVLDNRDVFWGQDLDGKLNANNDILIIGDHASNDLKFLKPTEQEQGLMRSFEAFDAGSNLTLPWAQQT